MDVPYRVMVCFADPSHSGIAMVITFMALNMVSWLFAPSFQNIAG